MASVVLFNRSEGDMNYKRLLKYYKNLVATKMKIIKLPKKIFCCRTMYGQTVMESKTKEDQFPATFKEQVPNKCQNLDIDSTHHTEQQRNLEIVLNTHIWAFFSF